MYPQSAALRVYMRALRMNPQVVTLLQRVSAASNNPIGPDSYTAFTLYRGTYKEVDFDEAAAAGVTLAAVSREWTAYSLDLTGSSAPNPQLTYAIADQQTGTFSGSTTSGSNVISSVASTTGILYGMAVVGSGIPAFSKIISTTSTTITIDQNATATATGVSLSIGDWWLVEKVFEVVMNAAFRMICNRAR